MDEFVNFYSMSSILRYTKNEGFFSFLLDIAEEGADIDQLLEKFMYEIRYSSDPVCVDALFDLLLLSTMEAIDIVVEIDKFAKSINTRDLDKKERIFYYHYLKELGAHPGSLRKICI